MDASPRSPASFLTQTDALMRKNLVLQKRNGRANCCIILFPVLLCLLIALLQDLVNSVLDELETNPVNICDCQRNNSCVPASYFQLDSGCGIPSPIKWPPLLQLPVNLPDEPCKETESCPAAILLTGDSQIVAKSLARNMFRSTARLYISGKLSKLADFVLGTRKAPSASQFFDQAFFPGETIYVLQHKCRANFSVRVPFRAANHTVLLDVKCVEALPLWRNSSSVMNDEILKGYGRGNVEGRTKEIATAYDFFNTNRRKYNVSIGYNSSYSGVPRIAVLHTARSINMASNSYLRFLKGRGVKMNFEYVSEMPRLAIPRKKLQLDISSLMGVLFFFWTVELLFPVILNYLVYEKQRKLRIMMKMHGLGDGPYWIISYGYFLLLSSLYLLFLVTFGSFVGLKFFLLNNYSIQFVFYFIYINLQIALAFLVATYFSHVKTATVIGYIYVASSGFLGEALFKSFLQDSSLPRSWIALLELFPAFSLYRGMYEFSQYALDGLGMQWKDLNDRENGMKDVLLIMLLEWFLLLPAAYYFDQAASLGDGFRRGTSFFWTWFRRKDLQTSHQPVFQQQHELNTSIEMESSDISREREVVGQLLQEPSSSYPIVCDELKKVYPGRDGNPEKIAVKGLSLALQSGECLGMLGPNGAGKTSLISMLIGFTEPTSGTAYIQGMDIRTDMNNIYSGMGVCPQHDLLWETLTGREHLMFYGRLKSLKGAALAQAVEESLESVNLLSGGLADKQAGKYSGGMKRRLSVAISLIGDPKVVYLDEPSTGLDPASRKELWNAVKRAKKDRAIILTTHSMDEAEFLCDRLGIFVDGNLKCIGNSKELKSRYGGLYRLTITTPAVEEKEVEHLVRTLSPHAYKIYQLSGTQKFEMPKQEVRISDVFQAIESAKRKLTIIAWGLADTTLEDVFIKVAKDADAFRVL